ncbi:MAG TPA: toll/interleukin-1 receptor domain-containing protein, partial [Prosthecobacter sp.]
MPDTITLTSSQITLSIQPLLDELGKTYRERFEGLLPLFENGKASLAQALEVVAPGKARADALAAFQVFCTRLNTAAAKVHAGFELVVDSEKRRSPEERFCWLEGPDPALANLAAFTTEAVSPLDRVEALVQPSGVVTTGLEMERGILPKPLIRFFLSYAHKDESKVLRLEQLLETQLKLSKRFQFEIWHDRKIKVGTGWHDDIQNAITECDFGLLLVSPEFLVSRYISEHELPHFVTGAKPLIPVGLVPVDFGRMDLKGLQENQFFLLKRPGEQPRPFSHSTGNLANEFAATLASEIERRVTSSVTPAPV